MAGRAAGAPDTHCLNDVASELVHAATRDQRRRRMTDDSLVHTWTSLWMQYIGIARDLAHEVLTRREGLESTAAIASRARLRSASCNLASRFGDADALVFPLSELDRTFLALLAAFVRRSGSDAPDAIVAELTASTDLIAAALAEYARIHLFAAEYTSVASIRRIATLPLAAHTLAYVSEYSAREYLDSSLAYESLTGHVCTVLAPLFDMFLDPADDMDLRLETLLRASTAPANS